MTRKSLLNHKKPNADLQQYYFINLQIGFVITLIILNILFRVNFNPDTVLTYEERAQDIIEMEDVVLTQQDFTPPPPERPAPPVPVPNDEIVDDDMFDLDTEFDLGEMAALPPPPPPADDMDDEPEIFTFVEDMPELKGGMDAVYRNLRYPEIARRAGIEGRVVVQFVIDEQGNVRNPRVVRGVGGGLDEAAVEAVQKVSFTPGRQRGRPVKVEYTLTIHFQLSQANSK